MLVKLIILRLTPVLGLGFCKERKKVKAVFMMIGSVYSVLFCAAVWRIFCRKKWMGLLCLILSAFPHGICYGFAGWILARCIWGAWSSRVWKRIYKLALLSIFFGMMAENSLNPAVLCFFQNFFKKF